MIHSIPIIKTFQVCHQTPELHLIIAFGKMTTVARFGKSRHEKLWPIKEQNNERIFNNDFSPKRRFWLEYQT
jgi:hypothetical protein